jgi:glycogen debranching enzyme
VITLAETLAIKDGNVFMMSLRDGRVPAGGDHPLGLWFRDCRFLGAYELTIGGERPTLLTSTDAAGHESLHELTNADRTMRLRVVRTVEARGALHERITVQSHGREPVATQLELRLGADFLPMLELRGLVPRHARSVDAQGASFAAQGRDGVRRATTVRATPSPRALDDGSLVFDLELEPRGTTELTVDLGLSETSP